MAKVDAVYLPLHYGKGTTYHSKVESIKKEFLPILECKQLYPRLHGDGTFLTGNVADSLLFPAGHERHKEERYEWTDRGDGVKLGVLVPDPPVAEPEVKPEPVVEAVPETPHAG